jgi:uncharacterized membrane protein
MSDLVVSVFDEEFRAQEVRIDLLKRGKKHLADLEDAVVIRRTATDQIKLHHVSTLTLGGIVGGGFLGSLLGVILLNPVFALVGMAAGAIAGAVSGSMSHVGVTEEFIRELAEHLKPGTSALCVLVSRHLDEILEEIAGYGGKVLQSSLLHEDEAKLLAVLDSMKTESGYGAASEEKYLKPGHGLA